MKTQPLTYLAQGLAAVILAMASATKFLGAPDAVLMFEKLGMEPTGRFVIAVVEMTAALLLLSPFAALGAALAVAVMSGAIIAHATRIGIVVNGDGGQLFGMLVAVLISSAYVLVRRRRELPLIGKTL